MKFEVKVDEAALKDLKKALKGFEYQLPRHVAVVINKTQKATISYIAKQVSKRVNLKQKDIKAKLQAGPKASASSLGTTVTIPKSKRLGVEKFGARQTKVGVKYKINKQGQTMLEGAFMGPVPGVLAPKLYGGAFIRISDSRLPIAKLRAVSVWGVVDQNKLALPTARFVEERLTKEINNRIEFLIAKREGKI
tara:strand:+ start:1041 stop:1619 length:579 start_codon:yes stop_codon:yes gene_type:complete